MSRYLLIPILSLTLLAGCGFKLRGNFDMPAVLNEISIEGGERDLTDLLEKRLTDSGSAIVPPGSDKPTIIITRSELERKVRTRDANGLATGYTFLYTVDFTVTDGVGGILSNAASISQVKTLEFDAEQVLQAEREEEFLVEEMEEDIVLQMMRRLARI